MADSEIMIEVYGTSPYVDLDVDQATIDLEQADPNVLIAAVPIIGDTGATGAMGPTGGTGLQGVSGPVGPQGDPGVSWQPVNVISEIVDFSLQDGAKVTFPLAHEAYASTIEVYRNGLMEFDGLGYGMTSSATTTHVTFTTAPLSSDVIAVRYLKVQ